jgi:trehalose-phosphatase
VTFSPEQAAQWQGVLASASLLVMTDVDGTIAPLAPSPDLATPDARCMNALARLAAAPGTRVGIASGRPLVWLEAQFHTLPAVMLFGSHGAEERGVTPALVSAAQADILHDVDRRLRSVVARFPACVIERKPFAVALHYRGAEQAQVPEVLAAAVHTVSDARAVRLLRGSMVLEWSVSPRTKGDAIASARRGAGAMHVIFIGDDATDEDAFESLRAGDVGVKVGPGPTCAPVRVGGVTEVACLLEEVVRARA